MKYAGVDYYPEQWGMEHVDRDLDDIVELGADLIRIGDFAWDVFEPEDGRYDFSFFDEVIAKTESEIEDLTSALKEKKAYLKTVQKQKAEAERIAAEKKAEEDREKILEAVLKSSKSVDEIIEFLK